MMFIHLSPFLTLGRRKKNKKKNFNVTSQLMNFSVGSMIQIKIILIYSNVTTTMMTITITMTQFLIFLLSKKKSYKKNCFVIVIIIIIMDIARNARTLCHRINKNRKSVDTFANFPLSFLLNREKKIFLLFSKNLKNLPPPKKKPGGEVLCKQKSKIIKLTFFFIRHVLLPRCCT